MLDFIGKIMLINDLDSWYKWHQPPQQSHIVFLCAHIGLSGTRVRGTWEFIFSRPEVNSQQVDIQIMSFMTKWPVVTGSELSAHFNTAKEWPGARYCLAVPKDPEGRVELS